MCDCGSNKEYQQCCGLYIENGETAPSPEALMRSRYTAFARQKMDYLLATQDPQTRDQFDLELNQDWAKSVRFMGLEILRSEEQGTKGMVEFRATFQALGAQETQIHHELSRFRKHKNTWYFREGKIKQNT